MADIHRTWQALLGLLPLNDTAEISAQDVRDFVIASRGYTKFGTPTPDHDSVDTAGEGAFFAVGSRWIDLTNGDVWICWAEAPGLAQWANVTQGAGSPTGLADTAILGANFNFTAANNVWESTGFQLNAPEAGMYQVWANVRGQMEFSAGADGVICARLYDATAAAAIIHTTCMIGHHKVQNDLHEFSASCMALWTIAGASDLELQVMRERATTWTTCDLLSDGLGETIMGYSRLAM